MTDYIPMTVKEFRAIKNRMNETPAPPWEVTSYNFGYRIDTAEKTRRSLLIQVPSLVLAEFLANARGDILRLLAEIDHQKACWAIAIRDLHGLLHMALPFEQCRNFECAEAQWILERKI